MKQTIILFKNMEFKDIQLQDTVSQAIEGGEDKQKEIYECLNENILRIEDVKRKSSCLSKHILKKSRIQETLTLSTDADHRTRDM